jgi:hypothetical protein
MARAPRSCNPSIMWLRDAAGRLGAGDDELAVYDFCRHGRSAPRARSGIGLARRRSGSSERHDERRGQAQDDDAPHHAVLTTTESSTNGYAAHRGFANGHTHVTSA